MSGIILPCIVTVQASLPCQSRIITVVISSMNALKKLARAMTFMPNLHTIHIMHDLHGDVGDHQFQVAFSGLVFPSIRHAILPITALDIIASFPEVVEVHMNTPFFVQPQNFLHDMISNCPKVECIGWQEPVRRQDQGSTRCKYTSMACA
jgi:hypothetical protein